MAETNKGKKIVPVHPYTREVDGQKQHFDGSSALNAQYLNAQYLKRKKEVAQQYYRLAY